MRERARHLPQWRPHPFPGTNHPSHHLQTPPPPFQTYKEGQQDDVPWETASEGKETMIV